MAKSASGHLSSDSKGLSKSFKELLGLRNSSDAVVGQFRTALQSGVCLFLNFRQTTNMVVKVASLGKTVCFLSKAVRRTDLLKLCVNRLWINIQPCLQLDFFALNGVVVGVSLYEMTTLHFYSN